MRPLPICLLLLVACGGNSGGGDDDSPPAADASVADALVIDASPPDARPPIGGQVAWTRPIGDFDPTAAVGGDGRFYVAGWVGNANFDGTVLTSQGGYYSVALVAFDAADGHVLWARKIVGCQPTLATALRVLPGGDVVMIGGFNSEGLTTCRPSFAGQVHPEPWGTGSGSGVFMARWTASGDEVVLRQWGSGVTPGSISGIEAELTGIDLIPGTDDAVVVGYHGNSLVIGGTTVSSGLAARIPLDGGDARWVLPLPAFYRTVLSSVVVDGDHAVASFYFSMPVTIGAFQLTPDHGDAGLVAMSLADGHPEWAVGHGGSGSETVSAQSMRWGIGGVSRTPGGLRLVGSFEGGTTFGTFSASSAGEDDLFIAELDHDGAATGLATLGSSLDDDMGALVVLPGGDSLISVGDASGSALQRWRGSQRLWSVDVTAVPSPGRIDFGRVAATSDGRVGLAAGIGFGESYTVGSQAPVPYQSWAGILVAVSLDGDGAIE